MLKRENRFQYIARVLLWQCIYHLFPQHVSWCQVHLEQRGLKQNKNRKMSWFKRVTGIQELINEQKETNYYLREQSQMQKEKRPTLPRTKKYK